MFINDLKSIPVKILRREKCVKQLDILPNLRNLQKEIIKQLENMTLTYDIETDIRFQQGQEMKVVETIKEMLNDKSVLNKYIINGGDFKEFKGCYQNVLANLDKYKTELNSLIKPNFQTFLNVKLMNIYSINHKKHMYKNKFLIL